MKTKQISGLIIIGALIFKLAGAQTWQWKPETSGTTKNLWGVQFLDANNGFACGDAGTVLKTSNGGTTWSAVNIASANPVRGVSFTSTSQGWAVLGDPANYTSTGEVYVTANGGTTWTAVTNWGGSPYANLSVQFFSPTSGYVGATHNSGGSGTDVYYTANGGTSWTPNPANIDWNWIYGMSFLNASMGWIVGDGLSNGNIFYTSNGGSSWSTQNTGGFYYGVAFKNASLGWVVGASGAILATINGGTAWNAQSSPVSKQLNGVCFASTTTGWAAGDTGTIVMTTNGGTLWKIETSGTTANLNAIVCTDSNTAWTVGGGGVILKRTFVNGISEIKSGLNVSIYPNPFHGQATLIIAGKTNALTGKLLVIKIYNVFGQEIENIPLTLQAESNQITIFRNTMASGLYLYSIMDDSQSLAQGKMLVQ